MQVSYDQQIMDILDNSSRSISAFEISLITGIPHHRVCKKLRKFQSYDLIFCSTVKKVGFWKKKKHSREAPRLTTERAFREGGRWD